LFAEKSYLNRYFFLAFQFFSATLFDMKRKKLLRKVDLRFFQDEANGEWGVTHKETCPGNGHGEEFNAFWDGIGIFHDVFEHAHEFTDKYFKAYPYVLTTAGEMVAMGAAIYYRNRLLVSNRERGGPSFYTFTQSCRNETLDRQVETIHGDGGQYSGPLESCVPAQEDTEDGELEWAAETHWQKILEAKQEVGKRVYQQDPDEIARAQEFADSVTAEKITNLYRYGYHMAEKLMGEGLHNHNAAHYFIEFWNDFCKRNTAEKMAAHYKGIVFRLYRDENGELSWTATFIPQHVSSYERAKEFKVKGDNNEPQRVPYVADEYFPKGEE
jgi:hypothetical protein